MSTAPTQPRDRPPRTPREPGSVSPDAAQYAPTTPPAPGTPDTIGAWLDRLVRLTCLPTTEASEIREELDAHLRERVRDLMLVGHDEPDAIHKSISELGDLALLAQRYRESNRSPKGRIIMHIALFSAVTAALGLSTLAFQQSGSSPTAPPAAHPAQVQPEAGLTLSIEPTVSAEGIVEITPVLSGIPALSHYFAEGDLDLPLLARNTEGEEIGAILGSMGEAADARVYTYWNTLVDLGFDSTTVLDAMPFEGQTIDKAFSMLSDALNLRSGERLAYRLDNGLMEIATVGFFDRRELDLVGYEVAFLLDAGSALEQSNDSQTLITLVTTLVEPEVWEDNGGYATISAAGNQLFVNAPLRVHSRVAWLLGELAKETVSSRDTLLPPPPPTTTPTTGTPTHTVRPGDTLTSIAQHALGSPRRAREIIASNPGLTADSLEVGRVLTLPPAVPDSVRIEGAVSRPGTYQLPIGSDYTLARLITSAGGPSAGAKRVILRRDEGEGQVIDMMDIASVLSRTETDKKLSAGDWVFVMPE